MERLKPIMPIAITDYNKSVERSSTDMEVIGKSVIRHYIRRNGLPKNDKERKMLDEVERLTQFFCNVHFGPLVEKVFETHRALMELKDDISGEVEDTNSRVDSPSNNGGTSS